MSIELANNGPVVEVDAPVVPLATVDSPEVPVVALVPVPGPTGATGPPGTPGDVAGQLRIAAVAAVALSGHRVVTPQPDGAVTYASSSTGEHVHGPWWLTLGAAAAGDQVQAALYGAVVEPSWSWTPGAPLYLGSAGILTEIPPVAPGALFLARVAVATSPTSVFVDPFPPIVLS